MISLVHSKQTEEVGWWLVRRRAAFPFPECCRKIVTLGQDGTETNVKGLCQCLQVDQSPR